MSKKRSDYDGQINLQVGIAKRYLLRMIAKIYINPIKQYIELKANFYMMRKKM